MGLTRRQAEILAYITEYSEVQGYAPTLKEIGQRFGLSSAATVHKHVSLLVEKGYLSRGRRNASRDMVVVDNRSEEPSVARVPLLGTVAAGLPIEALTEHEEIILPEEWLGRGRTYALRVRGDSMIEEQIRDGDTVVVSSDRMKRPVAVRYGWAINPVCNLFNKDGLPATPFRTDTWRGVTWGK